MTATWTTQISESKWRRVRRELEDNGLVLPFTHGVAYNRKTGYTLTNKYDRESSQLEIRIAYPPANRFWTEVPLKLVHRLLNNLLDSVGETMDTTGLKQ